MNAKQTRLWVVLGVIFLAAVLCTLYLSRTPHTRKLARVLAQVDFRELLTACRELLSRAEAGTLATGSYWLRLNRQPRLPDVPVPISNLNPMYVRVDKGGYVELEMGGLPFWGFVAYATDNKEDYSFQGDAEIIPGLWYYDEDYGVHARITKEIDTAIQEAKTRQGILDGGGP